MEIKTIDDRIRANAREQLIKDINEAAQPLKRALHLLGTKNKVVIKTTDKQDVHVVYDHETINAFIDAAVERQAPKAEDAAVAAFLNKVESLQGQVDDLYSEFGDE